MNRRLTLVHIVLCLMAQSPAAAQISQYGNSGQQLALSTPAAPNNLQMLRTDAFVLFSSSQFVSAAAAYSRLIQLGSTDGADRYWLGESLYHLNDFQRAATAFEQAIQVDPKLEQAYTKLAETYIALHQKDKAQQVCSAGLKMVVDPYRHQQLELLLKLALMQDRKPTRNKEVRSNRLPMES